MMVPDSVFIQWKRFFVVDAHDGTVLSEDFKVLDCRRIYAGNLWHWCATIVLNHRGSYNPYSNMLIELVVQIGGRKCNVVIVDKGDNPTKFYFDGNLEATTDQVTQDHIKWAGETHIIFKKWFSLNFWKRPNDP